MRTLSNKIKDMLKALVWHANSFPSIMGFKESRIVRQRLSLVQMAPLQVFHAGTSSNDAGEVTATGGRVLGVTAVAADVEQAQKKAYQVSAVYACAV